MDSYDCFAQMAIKWVSRRTAQVKGRSHILACLQNRLHMPPLLPLAMLLDISFALSNCKLLTSLLNLVSLRIYLPLLPKEAMKGDFSCSGK